MQSTTLLCPTSPSCLLFAPALTNLFSLSPNPHTSLFILSPSITHFPLLQIFLCHFIPVILFFFFFLSLGFPHPSPASTSPSLLPFLCHLHIYLSLSVRGRGGRVSFRGDSFPETRQGVRAHTDTHAHTTYAGYLLSPQ